MKNTLRFLGELVFPPRCVSCGTRMTVRADREADYFCTACEAEWQKEQLSQCSDCFCEYYSCRCQPRILQRAGATALFKLTPYVEDKKSAVTNRLIKGMKHSPRRRPFAAVATDLAPLLALAVKKSDAPAMLVHLPRTKKGVRREGFDHAAYLADALSASSGIPHKAALIRYRDGKEQKKLTLRERVQNVKGAFGLKGSVKGFHIILVDDVVTTGASVAEATKILLSGGAAAVTVLAVSHTPKVRA